jgi:translation initiation factor 1
MIGAMAKRPPPPTAQDAAPFHAPFAALRGRLDEARAGGEATPPGRESPPEPRPAGPPPPARAVVRMERAGRGGKTVTVVEQLGLPARQLEAWLSEAKRALGCGGAVEGAALVLQGDCRGRAAAWLEQRGVRRVTVA